MSGNQLGGRLSPASRISSWDLWSTPRALLAYVLVVESVVVLSAGTLALLSRPHAADFGRLALLLGLGLMFEEISARIARLRSRLAVYSHVDMTSVWTFAAAIVLPLGLIAPLCALALANSWLRYGRQSGIRLYRHVFAAAGVVVAGYAARAVVTGFTTLFHNGGVPGSLTDVLAISCALLTYLVVNGGVLYTAIYLAVRPDSFREVLNSWQDVSLEIATLCLGGLTALVLVQQPLLTLLVVPPMFVLQRSMLTKQLEVAATTDAKTGLLNAATWHHVAGRELSRAEREEQGAALLIIDMDNFKRINDSYGHLIGDDVLKAVADCLAEEMRGYDSIGRFGGEEFVAVLSDVDELAALTISERIRQRISRLEVPSRDEGMPTLRNLSASIGVACYPDHGLDVETLLHAADSALYRAKRAGRNRVELSGAGRQVG